MFLLTNQYNGRKEKLFFFFLAFVLFCSCYAQGAWSIVQISLISSGHVLLLNQVKSTPTGSAFHGIVHDILSN